ncbi:hypothetical protein SNEBB_010278 [Seison nebaliae]|nr:hypothetical protein SNEBB_010278 [Seison nebaliae]
MPSKIISVRNKFLEHPELKHNDLNLVDDNSKGLLSKIVDWTSQTVEYGISGMNNTVESYRRSNHLLTTYMSTLTNFLHFLFYGGGGVNKDECVIHIFHGGKLDEVATEIKYNSLFPRKIMLDEDSVSYFPHLSIIYIEIFFSIFEVLKNKENVTLQNFESHLHIPWSDNTFLTEDLWLPKKTAYLVIRYGLPSTVFVSFQDRGYNYMNQPELVTIIGRPVIFLVKMLKENLRMSNEVIGHTKKSFDETNVLEVLKLMENEIKMRFARIKIKLPPEFWCGDIPCRKRLFSNCPMYKYDTEEYTLFGIAFRKSSSVYEIKTKLDEIMIENLEYSTAKEETFNMAFSYVMNQLQGYNVTDRIEKYIRNFAEEMATIKTVMNFKYINRLTARHKNISFPKIDIVSKPGMHSVALVRTFSLKWWYINNNDITPVKNVKEFILNLQISLIPELTAWQRIYNDANLLKNLREIIQPIKLPTTNQKI